MAKVRLGGMDKAALGITGYNDYEITIDTDDLQVLLGRARSNTTGKSKSGPIRVRVLTDTTEFVAYYAPAGTAQDEYGVRPVKFDLKAYSFEAAQKMAYTRLARYFKKPWIPSMDTLHVFKRLPGNPNVLRNRYGAAPHDLEAVKGFDFEEI